ncbi:hypothetical protein IMCC26134_08315 [Verrucomicrobia bacterium IMCC26134]|nr:hypothetical protein IMCC26134_08315 [Verrucomicrobia bacterium IMCC26134]
MNLFDLVQAQQIHAAEVSAERAGNKVIGVEGRLGELESRFNRLALVTHSLWDLLKDRHGYTGEELRDWVTLTDLKDGKLDGRLRQTTAPLNCHKCNRVISRAFARCMYCDEPAAEGDIFDRVH